VTCSKEEFITREKRAQARQALIQVQSNSDLRKLLFHLSQARELAVKVRKEIDHHFREIEETLTVTNDLTALERKTYNALYRKTGNLAIDFPRYKVLWKDKHVKLTFTEFALVAYLSAHPDVYRDRGQLMGHCLSNHGAKLEDERTVDSHIKRIRKSFRAVDPGFDQISTGYGMGYVWVREDLKEERARNDTTGA